MNAYINNNPHFNARANFLKIGVVSPADSHGSSFFIVPVHILCVLKGVEKEGKRYIALIEQDSIRGAA